MRIILYYLNNQTKEMIMYIIVWENAYGIMCQSEKMNKDKAQIFFNSLFIKQYARMFYVNSK